MPPLTALSRFFVARRFAWPIPLVGLLLSVTVRNETIYHYIIIAHVRSMILGISFFSLVAVLLFGVLLTLQKDRQTHCQLDSINSPPKEREIRSLQLRKVVRRSFIQSVVYGFSNKLAEFRHSAAPPIKNRLHYEEPSRQHQEG